MTTAAILVLVSTVALTFSEARSSEGSMTCSNGSHDAAIVSNGGIYVRLEAGHLQRSLNEKTWADCPLKIQTFLRELVYANGVFVAVGGSYFDEPCVIVTSRDGTNWTRRSLSTKINLYGVAFGNGVFVTVGEAGAIFTSPHGITWKPHVPKPTDALLATVTFGNSRFVVGGESGTILTSTNGIDWTHGNLGAPIYVGTITFHHGAFVVASAGMIFKSDDGLIWHRCLSEESTASATDPDEP
jgi:photosystem II stability/assembly factor-like uncharacterized protein